MREHPGFAAKITDAAERFTAYRSEQAAAEAAEIEARAKLRPNEVSRYDREGINKNREAIIRGEMVCTDLHLSR
jgi:hypothetical protein